MNVLVCMKQVPQKDSVIQLRKDRAGIEEEDLEFTINECDLFALEEALRIKESQGGEVTVLSAGPARVTKLIRNALALGADRAFHINSSGRGIQDPFVLSWLMAQTIGDQVIDLILTGVQSEDLGFSCTGPMLAERLGWNHATMVTAIHHLSREQLVVGCETDGGVLEEVTLKLPAVLCFQSGSNHPRYATLKGIMAAKKKEIRQWNLDSPEFSTLPGSPDIGRVEIQGLFPPEKKKNTVWLEGTPKEVARKLIEALRADAKIP